MQIDVTITVGEIKKLTRLYQPHACDYRCSHGQMFGWQCGDSEDLNRWNEKTRLKLWFLQMAGFIYNGIEGFGCRQSCFSFKFDCSEAISQCPSLLKPCWQAARALTARVSAHEGKTVEDSPTVCLSLRMKCGMATAGRLSDSTSQPERNHKAAGLPISCHIWSGEYCAECSQYFTCDWPESCCTIWSSFASFQCDLWSVYSQSVSHFNVT